MNNVSLPRELVNQVLHALEVASSCIDGYYVPRGMTTLPEIVEAENALRGVLAQEQSEPAQEPVAWQCREHGDDEWFDCSKESYGINPRRYTYRALCTTPPKSEPLPLKDVERLIYENTKINPNVADDKELLGYIVNAIRAVERAHNIVE